MSTAGSTGFGRSRLHRLEHAAHALVDARPRGERRRGNAAAAVRLERLDLADQGVGVVLGRHAVADEHVRPPGLQRLERIGHRGRRAHHGAALLQHGPEQLAAVGILIEDQDAQTVERRRRRKRERRHRHLPDLGRAGLQGESRGEHRPVAAVAVARANLAAVELDEIADERQAHAEPAGGAGRRRVLLREPIEDARQEFRIDARAAVRHGQHGGIAGLLEGRVRRCRRAA